MNILRSLSDEVAALVQRVRPAVLHLETLGGRGGGTGSGFLCGRPDLALTNHHVIAKATAVRATLADGRTEIVDVIGSDPATDLALLRVPDVGVEPLALAADERLRVGDYAFAVGCPHGLSHTVTAGIISALGRSLAAPGGNSIEDVVQTDAPLNPGNSGGPLLDADGQVVGVATAIVQQAQGLCFAVPATTARVVFDELQQHGQVVRGFLGVAVHGIEIAPTIALRLGLPSPRALAIAGVTPGSPAHRAGLAANDLLLSVDGRTIRGVGDLMLGLPRASIGGEVEVRYLRQNEILTARVRPIAQPQRAA